MSDGYKEVDCVDMRNYVAYYLRNWGFDVVTDGEGRRRKFTAQAAMTDRFYPAAEPTTQHE